MQVAKITLFNGQVYYTDDFSNERLRQFFANVRVKYAKDAPPGSHNQVDLIEMTPEEYAAIPATMDSAEMFRAESTAKGDKHG